jgi:hypothetical protein
VHIDNPMRIVLDRLEGKSTPPPKPVRYTAPLILCTLAIVSAGLALLLESRIWGVPWRAWGMAGFGTVAVLCAGAVVVLMLRGQPRR